jgi:hypothetical protein
MIPDTSIPVRKIDLEVASQRRQPETTEYFLKGPIPLPWLEAAAKLPGKAYVLGNILWWHHGMSQGSSIKVTKRSLERFAISEDAYRDGLQRLEDAGLVSVLRRPGQRAEVRIKEI